VQALDELRQDPEQDVVLGLALPEPRLDPFRERDGVVEPAYENPAVGHRKDCTARRFRASDDHAGRALQPRCDAVGDTRITNLSSTGQLVILRGDKCPDRPFSVVVPKLGYW